MARAARFEPGTVVFDVGCGTGAPACAIVADYDVRVVGISTSLVGVAAASERAAAAGLAHSAEFTLADGMNNHLPDASFDRVWALESSHLMLDRDHFVTECARVLRPGGRFVLCDIVRRRDIPFPEVRARLADFQVLRQVFGEARTESLAVYRELMTAAGLVVDEEEDLTAATGSTFGWWRKNAEANRDAVQHLLGSEDYTAFVRSTHVLESLWADGTLGYGLIAATKPA